MTSQPSRAGVSARYPMIVRIAGLPAQVVDAFGSDLPDAILDQLDLEEELGVLRAAMVERLYSQIKGAPSEVRHFLLAVKRACFNGRSLERLRDHPGWPLLAEVAPDLAPRLLGLEERLAASCGELAERYLAELYRERRHLMQFLDRPDLLRGITLGSLVVADQLGSLAHRDPKHYGRNERRLEATLLRYLTRAALKLSPFSTLTRIGFGEVVETPRTGAIDLGQAEGWSERSLVSLRRMLLDQHTDVLLAYPPFRHCLPVFLNDTLEALGDRDYRLLRPAVWTHSEGETELEYVNPALVRVRLGGPLVTWLKESLGERKVLYRDLLAELAGVFDSDPQVLQDTVDKLLEIGFLSFVLPWTTSDLQLEPRMLEYLETLLPDPGLEPYVGLLRQQVELQETYSGAESPVAVVQESKRQVEAIWQALAPLGGIDPAVRYYERPMDHYFAEDVFLTPRRGDDPVVARVGREEARGVVADIDPLARLANLFSTRCDILHTLAAFAAEQWPGVSEVGFIELFQASQPLFQEFIKFDIEARLPGALESPMVFNPFGRPELDELLRWRRNIGPASWQCNRPTNPAGDEQALDIVGLNRLLDEVPLPYAASRDFCAFVQPVPGGRWVLNCFYEGMGRMSSRYTTLMDESLRRRWVDYFTERSRFEQDGETVELIDIFCPAGHTINVHAPQTHRVIEIPGESSGLERHRRLGLRDLRVRLGEPGALPRLVDGAGQLLLPLHLGGLVFRFMPNLFKFLTLFGPGEFRFRVPRIPEQPQGDLRVIPRHTAGKVVYVRKSWVAERAHLLPLLDGQRSVEAFETINRWRLGHGIPDRVFVTEAMAGGMMNPRRKPQYIDFGSPLLVEIFRSIVKVDFPRIRIVEALPDPEDLCQTADGQRWAAEIQLDNFGL